MGAVGRARLAGIAGVGLFGVEIIGSVAMWAALPVAWFWIGARVYDVTGSVGADLAVVLVGFIASAIAMMSALARVDALLIVLRRAAGCQRGTGTLNGVVIATATAGIIVFIIWAYILDQAFVMPFMPMR